MEFDLARLYREAGGNRLIETAERLNGSGNRRERVLTVEVSLARGRHGLCCPQPRWCDMLPYTAPYTHRPRSWRAR